MEEGTENRTVGSTLRRPHRPSAVLPPYRFFPALSQNPYPSSRRGRVLLLEGPCVYSVCVCVGVSVCVRVCVCVCVSEYITG